MKRKPGRPPDLTMATKRQAVARCMLELLTQSVVINQQSRQARLIADGHDSHSVFRNITERPRTRTQGTKKTHLPAVRAEKIMEAISRVPLAQRVQRGALAASIETTLSKLTCRYPVRAQKYIREACIGIAPDVPSDLSKENIKKLYREWQRECDAQLPK